jgi:hypothetical protein
MSLRYGLALPLSRNRAERHHRQARTSEHARDALDVVGPGVRRSLLDDLASIEAHGRSISI